MSFKKEIISNSAEETFLRGKSFATSLNRNSVIGLYGNLGSGKTQFVKGICDYYNVKEVVNSPTFTIVNEYKGFHPASASEVNINHFDLYRLKNVSEVIEIGLDEYTNENSICLVEWPELSENVFNIEIQKIYFEHGISDNQRLIKF